MGEDRLVPFQEIILSPVPVQVAIDDEKDTKNILVCCSQALALNL